MLVLHGLTSLMWMTWADAATLEASGRRAWPCFGQVTSREVGSDIGLEFVWEGKLSETLWTWSNSQYCQRISRSLSWLRVSAHWPPYSEDCSDRQYVGPWKMNPRNARYSYL